MPDTSEDTTPGNSTQEKKPRAQLTHALFDVDFWHKPTIKGLRRKFKVEGACAYQEIIFQLSRATNAQITRDCALASIEEFGVENSEELLEHLLSQGYLELEGDKITQVRVIVDQEKLAEKRAKYRERQAKHRHLTKESEDVTRDMCVTDSVTPAFSVLTECIPSLDSSLGGAGTLSSLTPEALEAIGRWQKRCATLKKPFDALAAEALQMQYAGRSAELIRDINGSIAAGWRNVRPCPEEKKPGTEAPKTMQRRNLENLQKVMNGENPWADDPIFGGK